MNLAKASDYKDINTDTKMAAVTTEKVAEYLEQFSVEFDQKVIDLYEDKFLIYLRLCRSDSLDFIRSACRAEMKKTVNYIVDISLKKNGYVQGTQCECGAGEGPYGHCKHIRAVLYACCKFIKTGDFKVETSCTEKLQTFHKSKKHKGSPLKSRDSDLNLGGADICDIKDFDPRPSQYRKMEGYSAFFYNTCMNFRGISRTPIFQTFEPANIRAYANDHDYFKLTQEENFMRVNRLSYISDKDRCDIELFTRGQNKNDRWFDERQKRIQSSNFYRVCVATDRTNKDELAQSYVQGHSVRQTEAMRHGNKYEREAVHKYEQDKNSTVASCGIYVSRTLPFLGASPDGVVNDEVIVEVKCPFSAKNKTISPVTIPYLKEENGFLMLSQKHPYYYQIQGQLFCSERQMCDLIIYTLTDIAYIRIERNESFISYMKSELEKFNRDHFRAAVLSKYFYKEN